MFNFFDRWNGMVDGICRVDDLGEVSISRPVNGRKDPSVAPPCPHGGIISHTISRVNDARRRRNRAKPGSSQWWSMFENNPGMSTRSIAPLPIT